MIKIFNPQDPRHLEILHEELDRAAEIINETKNDDWSEQTLAVKDKTLGLPLYRGITSMLREDPRYDMLLNRFLRNIDKVALEDLTIKEINHFFDKLIAFRDKLNPKKQYDPTKSALTPDAYKDGQGRGGWQGD